jgi:hypothetical protein
LKRLKLGNLSPMLKSPSLIFAVHRIMIWRLPNLL